MKTFATTIVICAALLALGPGANAARHAAAPVPPYAGQCGLPAAQPLWAEFGWPTPAYEAIFGKPGIVVGASSGAWPQKMRDAGAATVYFDLNLKNRIGTTTKPADPALIDGRAKTFFDFAVAQTGCATPVIVLNELAGAGLVTPWSDNNAQYRQNALRFVQVLASFGAHPVMLIAARPYTGGDALVWWQQMAASAEIVREDYVPATSTWKSGPVLGNRTLRESYRKAVGDLTAIGIAPNRVGLMISFASTKGFGGRSGLQPDSAWYEVAKWQSLAAQQVAAETGIASVWSWGWGQWNAAEQDPAKAYALCAWLWTRSPTLCNAPKAIGTDFDPSRTTGQLTALTPGEQCVVGKQVLSNVAIQRLQIVTGERDTAYSALYQRLVESGRVPVPGSEVLAAERAVIVQAFGGRRGAYLAALRQAHASVDIARGVLGDQLRRAKLEATLDASGPSASEVQTFYDSYPDLLVRLVQAKPAPGWLGGKPKGLALAEVAPNRLFDLATGRSVVVRTSDGSFTVKALADALPLGAVPLGQAKPTIAAALRGFARGAAFDRWSVAQQRSALNDAICARDDLPQPAAVDLTSYLPFLRLG
ncbi:MAG TPA: hypothetical protein VIL98_05800 [Gaiellaceae bacterium]